MTTSTEPMFEDVALATQLVSRAIQRGTDPKHARYVSDIPDQYQAGTAAQCRLFANYLAEFDPAAGGTL